MNSETIVMDWIMVGIFLGFILCGVLVGYPLGVAMERRHSNRSYFRWFEKNPPGRNGTAAAYGRKKRHAR